MTKTSLVRITGIGLAVALALVGCSSADDDPSSDPDPTTTAADGTDDTSDDASGMPELVMADAGLDLPRTLSYAGAEVTITRATFSNATPHSYDRPDPDPSDIEVLFVELSTAYAESYPGSDARFALANVAIRTSDGRQFTARALDQSGVPIQATTTTETTVYFDVTPGDLVGATLVFDDGNHLPGVLPLEGPIPDSGYPARDEPGATSPVVFPSGCGRSTSQVELVSIEWDIDAGVDQDGQRVVMGRSARASNGTRMARIELATVAGADACGGTFFNYENVRLSIDGVVNPPLNTPRATLQEGEGESLIFGFEIPLAVTELTLLVGAPDSDPWSHAITIPTHLA
jgi:hypothetical protein